MFMSIESPFLPLSYSSNFQTIIGMSAYVNSGTLANYAMLDSLSAYQKAGDYLTSANLSNINTNISNLSSNLNTTNSNLSTLSSSLSAYQLSTNMSSYLTSASLTSINSNISTLSSDLATTNSKLSAYQLSANMSAYLTSASLTGINTNISSLSSNITTLSASLSGYQAKGSYLSASESANILYKANLSAGLGVNLTISGDKTQINVPSANLYMLGLKASATSTASLLTNLSGVYFDVLTGTSASLSASFVDNVLYFLVS